MRIVVAPTLPEASVTVEILRFAQDDDKGAADHNVVSFLGAILQEVF
jgi:hypothetical protein